MRKCASLMTQLVSILLILGVFTNACTIIGSSLASAKAATTVNINWPIWAMPTTRAKGGYFVINVSSNASASSVWNVTISTKYDSYELPITAISSPATNIWHLNVTSSYSRQGRPL
ncbi:MAG: hypothetical protein AB1485_01715 [Candidatus Thermoplasmatota archaeon]